MMPDKHNIDSIQTTAPSLEALMEENQALQEKVRILEAAVKNLTQSHEAAVSSYQTILNSKWWRMTAPGRKAGTWFKLKLGHTLPARAALYLLNHGVGGTLRKVGQKLHLCPPDDALDQAEAAGLKIFLKDKLRSAPAGSRILMISHEMSLSGAPLVLLYMADHIQQLGFQPVLLTTQEGPMLPEAERLGIPVIIDKTFLTSPARAAVLAQDYQMVIANTLECANIVHALNGTDIPVVWWLHESAASYEGLAGRGLLLDYTLEDNVHVYCVCDYARDLLLKIRPRYESRILNYYMPDYAGVKPDGSFKLPEHGQRKVFTIIGTLEHRKGYDILADAVRMLPDEVRDQCYFVIVAKPQFPDVEAHVKQLCSLYPNNVIHYPLLNRDEITCLHHLTDCLVCPSRDDPLPCVITEALSLGKPVISTENTGYASILRDMDSGLIYQNNDPKLLARCIEAFITQSDLAEKISANARATYEQYFSRDVFAKNVSVLMNRCLYRLSEEENALLTQSGKSGREAVQAFDQPKATVSVVIPSYNGGQHLNDLLTMLKQQTGLDALEIVIVDSGSTDGTLQYCKDHGVKLIQIPNSEFSHSGARNMGADAATGDILLFMTQDAMPDSTQWIKELIAPLLHDKVTAISPFEQCPEGTDLYYRVASYGHADYIGTTKGDQVNTGVFGGNHHAYRAHASLNDVSTAIIRKVFMRFRYRCEFAEDLDMGLRLLRSGYTVKLATSPLVIHGHNRNAGYYLKRGLVDAITLDELLHLSLRGTVKGSDAVAEIIRNYRQVQSALVQMHGKAFSSADEFTRQYKACIQQLQPEQNAAAMVPALADPLAENFIAALAPYVSASNTKMDLAGNTVHYLETSLVPFVKKNDPWTKDSTAQLCDCLYKNLLSNITQILACIGKDDPVYAVLEPLMQGV